MCEACGRFECEGCGAGIQEEIDRHELDAIIARLNRRDARRATFSNPDDWDYYPKGGIQGGFSE